MQTSEIMRFLQKEVDSIVHYEIKAWTIQVLQKVPVESMTKPASFNHHLPDERQKYGNCLHTRRVVAVCHILSEMTALDDKSRSILVSAAILHDVMKYGIDGKRDTITYEHPYLVRPILMELEKFDYASEIMLAVEGHMGRWSKRDTPKNSYGHLLHIADMVCSRENIIVQVEGITDDDRNTQGSNNPS